jgi:hypothetical protein
VGFVRDLGESAWSVVMTIRMTLHNRDRSWPCCGVFLCPASFCRFRLHPQLPGRMLEVQEPHRTFFDVILVSLKSVKPFRLISSRSSVKNVRALC